MFSKYCNSHLSEFSTIDTSILVLGALFAGNYFGGEVENLALQLRDATQWSDAIWAEDGPGLLAGVDPNTGAGQCGALSLVQPLPDTVL